MEKLPRLLALIALILAPSLASADTVTDAVQQADDARVAAIVACDRAKLEAILSDGLSYAHSSGKVDSKASYIAGVTGGETKIVSINFTDRKFTVAAPGVVLVTGRCLFVELKGDHSLDIRLNFLGVWHLEGGAWRFLAWQSCRLA